MFIFHYLSLFSPIFLPFLPLAHLKFVSLPFSSVASSTSRAGLWCIDVGSPSPAPSPPSNGLTHRPADAGTTQLPSNVQFAGHASLSLAIGNIICGTVLFDLVGCGEEGTLVSVCAL